MHVIGTAGHVDHGKSALVQRLTGIDPDRLEEEKRRGLTIDLGFAWLTLPSGEEVGIVDVPGHERFIKNMLAGAGGVSICLFVVAATEGWMPQSSEHLSVLEVLGVSSGVVAVTKSDAVDGETLAIAIAEVEEHVRGTVLEAAAVVPCSAVTGAGTEELATALDDVVRATPPVSDFGRARLWVDRVFAVAGAGTVVTGTLAGGAFEVGMDVEVVGASRGARGGRIRAIQSHKRKVERIPPGNRTALNISGLERTRVERGDAVVRPGVWRLTDRFDAFVRVLPPEISGREHVLEEKGAHLLYSGTAETPVRITLLDGDRITAGHEGPVQIHLRDPLPLGPRDRFVLRDAGRVFTFGGGEVLDPLPTRARRRDERRVALLDGLRTTTRDEALRAIVEAEGSLDETMALTRSGADGIPDDVRRLGDTLVSGRRIAELAATVRAALVAYHREHPLERGMPRELLRARATLDADAFQDLVAGLGDVVEEAAYVRLDSHRVALAPEQKRARDEIIMRIERGGFQPPLTAELGAPALVRALVEEGDLVRIGDFCVTAAQAEEARARVRSFIEVHGAATVAEIRDLLGTTRKYAVPLCEWLDHSGATRRRGDERILGPKP